MNIIKVKYNSWGGAEVTSIDKSFINKVENQLKRQGIRLLESVKDFISQLVENTLNNGDDFDMSIKEIMGEYEAYLLENCNYEPIKVYN